jgi:hypothetical protein
MKSRHATNAKKSLFAAGAALGLIALAGAPNANADNWGFHIGVGTSHVRPLPEKKVRVIESGPQYRLVTRRVWVEPIYEERTVRVEVPAVIEQRVVPTYNRFGRLIGRQTIRAVVREARVEYRTERVLVREGYFKTVTVRVPVERVTREVIRVGHDRPGLSVGFSYHDDDGPRHDRPHDYHRRSQLPLRRPVRVSHR